MIARTKERQYTFCYTFGERTSAFPFGFSSHERL